MNAVDLVVMLAVIQYLVFGSLVLAKRAESMECKLQQFLAMKASNGFTGYK